MKIWVDGIIRDMTAEETAAFEAAQEDMPAPEVTAEDRINALESAVLMIMAGGGGNV